YRIVQVPHNAGVLRCTAYAVYAKDCPPSNDSDVVVLAPGKKLIPKQVRTATGWKTVDAVLPRAKRGAPREYVWRVNELVGQKITIVLSDEDKRPGCHLFCTGFEFIPHHVFEGREFKKFMDKLVEEHKLPPAQRYVSEHFVALSNAEEGFTAMRL